MAEVRILAEINSYDDFHAALRARKEELARTFEDIDAISGMTAGYASKLLGPARVKHFGPLSTPSLPPALGARLVLIEDEAALQRYTRFEHNRRTAKDER